MRFKRLHWSVVVTAACLGTAALAWGAAESTDARAARAALSSLEASPSAKVFAAELIARARRALQRGDDARSAGDHAHGALLDGVAREWSEAGTDLARVAEIEARANETNRRASEAEAKVLRGRALLEETVARRGRAAEKLKELEKPSAGPPPKHGDSRAADGSNK